MTIRNCTREGLEGSLKNINSQKYDHNIVFRDIEDVSTSRSTKFKVRLTVKSSKGRGAAYNPITGRHVATACWHVHGDFFETLFTYCPDAVVDSAGGRITNTAGNWIDRNIGSIMYPLMHSEYCKCSEL